MSEQDLAAQVVAWLVDSHWSVYQEVACGSCVADIVATHRLDWMRSSLREQQKTYVAAGSAHGGHWTPFKETCDQIRRKLQAEGAPMRLKDLIDSVHTHYRSPSTARACLRHWIEQGKVDGVRLVGEGTVELA